MTRDWLEELGKAVPGKVKIWPSGNVFRANEFKGKIKWDINKIKILTVDIHSKLALKELKIPSENVSAMEVLVKHFKKMKMKDPLVVSPDLGGKERAEKFSVISELGEK